jgi:lipopolysaccharide export system permease protein
VFALPMGLLTATLLVFGRFSADQELTAARASGISLISLTTPILLLSLACCGLSAWINMDLGPRSRVAYLSLLSRVQAELLTLQLPEGQPIYTFPGYILMIGKNHDGNLTDVSIWKFDSSTNASMLINAPRGNLILNATNKELYLHLVEPRGLYIKSGTTNKSGITINTTDYTTENLYPTNTPLARKSKPSPSNMTFWQLRDELRDWEQRTSLPPDPALTPEQMRAHKRELAKSRNIYSEQLRVEMSRQLAFSFACFGFALTGIPLGIRVHRRETNIGIAIALILVIVYYSFVLVGGSLSAHPEWAPHLIFWLPNFIFQAVGAVLLWRANRGI